jgi:hypothetical protein
MARLGLLLALGPALLAGCGDDGSTASTTSATAVTFEVQGDLAVGDTYEAGGVSLTVHSVEQVDGDLVLVDAEACTLPGSPAGIPIEPAAWQLLTTPGEPAIARVSLDEPPAGPGPFWPERVALGDHECFRGRIPFRTDADPTAVVFTQLGQPVSWTVPPPR